MLKQWMVMFGLGLIAGQSGAAATLTDDLVDMSRIAFTSGNVGIDTTNPAFFGGDGSRLKRWISTSETITYSTPGDMRSLSVQTWFSSAEAGADFLFAASHDNVAFTPVASVKTLGAGGSPWLQAEYALSGLPAGTRYLRIGFPDGGTGWTPQIGRVVLDYERNDLELPSVFASNMVLQRGKKITLWGKSLDHDSVSISFRGTVVRTVANGGKWTAEIGPLTPGGPDSMEIIGAVSGAQTLRNILVGDVWICSGQSNMWFPLKQDRDSATEVPAATNPKIRLFSQTITAGKSPQYDVAHGIWSLCEPASAREFSAVAYYFAKELAAARGVPIGMMQAAIGGTNIESWMSATALQGDPDFAYAMDSAVYSKWYLPELNYPSGPYNAMLHPLMPIGITGILWYQGENNKLDPYTYRKLLPALIRDWRSGFKQGGIPFLVVQLPAYGLDPNWPEMREAQALAHAAMPEVGMTVNIDMGDSANIHPIHKRPFGSRLALLARGMVYGENIEYASPLFARSSLYKPDGLYGDSILIEFDHVGTGLKTTDGKSPEGFEIAGSDSVFFPAQAAIQGSAMVRINSPKVKYPQLFRYAWLNVPHVNLVNGVDLPAGPFRSSLSASSNMISIPNRSAPTLDLEIIQTAKSLQFLIHALPGQGEDSWAQESLYDLRGTLIRKGEVKIPLSGMASLRMDTESLPRGIYATSLTLGRERILKKVCIR